MTKEITKAIILQEIQDKFKLREFEPANFLFDETVVPVYNIDRHLQHWKSQRYLINVTSATSFLAATVPMTERWKLRAYNPIFMTGVYTLAGVYILRDDASYSDDFSYLDLKAGQSVSYLVTLPEAVTLEPGDELRVNVDGYTSTGHLRLMIDYQVEEIR